MSTLPVWLQNSNLPAFTDDLGSGLGSGSPPYVSIEGGRFTLIDSSGDHEPITTVAQNTGIPYFDCVIIDANSHHSQVFWGENRLYDKNSENRSPPLCWSDNGIGPSVNCSEPQAKACAPDPEGVNGCKWAVWGSATSRVTGKGIPACQRMKKIAVLIPDNEGVFLLRVPPNSLDNLRAYNNKFKGQPFTARDVVTRISFEVDGIGTLTFRGLDYIDAETAKVRNDLLTRKATDSIVGKGDVPRGAMVQLSTAPRQMITDAAPAQMPAAANAEVPVPAANSAATTPATTAAPVAPRRRGRPPKNTEPQTAAPFREAAAQFGVTQAPPPNASIAEQVKSLFD